MGPTLTSRDRDILRTLTQKVRALSVSQIARSWYGKGERRESCARARLRYLERIGLIQMGTRFAQPELTFDKPLVTLRRRERAPDFGPLSWQLKRRWCGPALLTDVVIATRRVSAFGGRWPRDSEVSHDVSGVASLYLHWVTTDAARANAFISEARLHGRGLRREGWAEHLMVPDGAVEGPTGLVLVEMAGRYTRQKLEAFAQAFSDYAIEIW